MFKQSCINNQWNAPPGDNELYLNSFGVASGVLRIGTDEGSYKRAKSTNEQSSSRD